MIAELDMDFVRQLWSSTTAVVLCKRKGTTGAKKNTLRANEMI